MINNWYERQIETLLNIAVLFQKNENDNNVAKLSAIVLKTKKLRELEQQVYFDWFSCEEHLQTIFSMFEDMGLTPSSTQQCIRLLIETRDLPHHYISGLCHVWDKYRTLTQMQEDLFQSRVLINKPKQYFYDTFRFNLKHLLGINEEAEMVLQEHYKHQADITKTLEVSYLTETSKQFHESPLLPNEDPVTPEHHQSFNADKAIKPETGHHTSTDSDDSEEDHNLSRSLLKDNPSNRIDSGKVRSKKKRVVLTT